MAIKPIIILTGYANSGKSTLVKNAEAAGWFCVSSSRILHEFARPVIGMFADSESMAFWNLDNSKTQAAYPIVEHRGNEGSEVVLRTKRDILIYLAEQCLVPVFGREIFARGIIDKIKSANLHTYKGVIIETIGGEELKIIDDILDRNKYSHFRRFYYHTHAPNKQHEGIDVRIVPTNSQPIFTTDDVGNWITPRIGPTPNNEPYFYPNQEGAQC